MSTSIEKRLSHLETALGINENSAQSDTGSSTDSDTQTDIQSRIHNLQESTNFFFQESSLTSSLKECDRLARELSPSGLLFTTDATNSSSSVHRKQEILARYEELQNVFEALEKIRDILLISNPSLAKKSGGAGKTEDFSADHIVSAPILSSFSFAFAADPVNEERLNVLTKDVLDVRERSYNFSRRVDAMVDRYYSVMDAVNEKMVLLQEETMGTKK